MKTLICYTSQTGFTKKYSEWLKESLDADLFELKEVQKKKNEFFDSYDAIIFAGWVMAAQVVKVKWFLERANGWKEKKLAIVAVGGSSNDNPDIEVMLDKLLSDEQKRSIKAFYCQGGFNYDKMNAPSKLAMKMFVNTLKKSKEEEKRKLAGVIDKSYDITDRKFIEPVVSYFAG